MVHLRRRARPRLPDAQRAVVRARDEVGARRRVVERHHRGDVVAVDADRVVELADVEGVQVVVLGGEGDVERLHRVPAQRVRLRLHRHLLERRPRVDVVQRERAVGREAAEHRVFRRVEPHVGEAVGAPREGLQRLRARRVPEREAGARRREQVVLPVVVDVLERVAPEVAAERLGVRRRRRRAPQLDGAVVRRRDEVVARAAEGEAAHEPAVRVGRPRRRALRQVPPPQLAVGAARDDGRERAERLRHAVHAVGVAAQRADERLREVAVELHRVHRARVLARALERVELRLRVARDAHELALALAGEVAAVARDGFYFDHVWRCCGGRSRSAADFAELRSAGRRCPRSTWVLRARAYMYREAPMHALLRVHDFAAVEADDAQPRPQSVPHDRWVARPRESAAATSRWRTSLK